jgi:adenylosuccinate lyase
MIQRYTRPEMGRIWADENKYNCWLEVELAASEALAELGEVPVEAAEALRKHAAVDVERLFAIEAEVKTSSRSRRRWPRRWRRRVCRRRRAGFITA